MPLLGRWGQNSYPIGIRQELQWMGPTCQKGHCTTSRVHQWTKKHAQPEHIQADCIEWSSYKNRRIYSAYGKNYGRWGELFQRIIVPVVEFTNGQRHIHPKHIQRHYIEGDSSKNPMIYLA